VGRRFSLTIGAYEKRENGRTMGFFEDAVAAGRGAVGTAQRAAAKAGALHLDFVAEFVALARRCAERGWHEANGGNGSLWLTERQRAALAPFLGARPTEWTMLEQPVPGLASEQVLVTAAGCRMDELARKGAGCLGVVELDISGSAWRPVFGFEENARPTSELNGHLLVLEARGKATGGESRLVYHCHPAEMVAYGKMAGPSAEAITEGLWRAMTETVMYVPEGVGYVGPLVPGSLELARASAEAAAVYSCTVWASHGLMATGATAEEAFRRMEVLVKAASIWLACRSAGMGAQDYRASVPDEVLEGICEKLGLPFNRALLGR